jgi:dTDP-4-amino-4,6-dideoxygalactose transaminase
MTGGMAAPVSGLHPRAPAAAPSPSPTEVRQPPVPFQRPEPPEPAAIMAYYERSQEAGFYSNGGPCARLLADRLSGYLGCGTFAIPVGNCTVGLMVALRAACGMATGERRIVLTPSYTFTATACAIEWAGFQPAFVDIEGRGWHMDPTALEAALERFGHAVAGVVACATFGTAPACAQRAAWRELCAAHGVPLVIDSAPGFGARDAAGRPLGGLGDTEVFSFHATKPFAIGEGGLIATADADLAAQVGRMVNFGLAPGTRVSSDIGMNAKLSELHAAAGLAMLDRIDDVVARRQANAARLREAIGADANLLHQAGAERSTWQIFHVLCPTPAMRERAVALAPEHGIEVRTMHDPALHTHPAFAGAPRGPLAVTETAAARALALPMANTLDDAAIARIAALVHAARS